MAHLKIDYFEVGDAAQRAGQAASQMEAYADDIQRSVTNKLGSLTNGASAHTSTAADLARRKASRLRDKAARYRAGQQKLESFASLAAKTDKHVSSRLASIKRRDSKGLNKWQKAKVYLSDAYQYVFGGTDFGHALDGARRFVVAGVDLTNTAIQKARDWFQYGDGRYYLKIALSITAGVGAILAVCNPFTGPLAVLIAASGYIAAGYAVVSGLTTITDNVKALSKDDDNPGLARYYGNTSSLMDFSKKHTTNRTIQNIAGATDVVGKTAGIVFSAGSLFVKTDTWTTIDENGVIKSETYNKLSWDRSTLRENVIEKYGFSYKAKLDDGQVVRDVNGNVLLERKTSGTKVLKNITGISLPGKGSSGWKYIEAVVDTANGVNSRYGDLDTVRKNLRGGVYSGDEIMGDAENAAGLIPGFGGFVSKGKSIRKTIGAIQW